MLLLGMAYAIIVFLKGITTFILLNNLHEIKYFFAFEVYLFF